MFDDITNEEAFFSEIERYRKEKLSSFNSLIDEIKELTTLATAKRKELKSIQDTIPAIEQQEKELRDSIKTLEKEKIEMIKQKEQEEVVFIERTHQIEKQTNHLESKLSAITDTYQRTLEKQTQSLESFKEEKQKEIDYLQSLVQAERENYMEAVAQAKEHCDTEQKIVGDMSKGAFIRKVQGILDNKKIPLNLLQELNR